MQKITRTHDLFYLFEDHNSPTKESFLQVADLIAQFLSLRNMRKAKIADIGCATGKFASYLNTRFSSEEIVGYELLDELISRARVLYPSIDFYQGSILDKAIIPKNTYDVITVLGVLSIFDDCSDAIENLIHWTKPGGKIMIHGMFNPFDIDIFIKYQHSGLPTLESGWNIISQKTLTALLVNHGATEVEWHKFNISSDLLPNALDPVRSWTEILANGDRQIVNGLFIKQPQFICEVTL